jgi:hypothetical protein
MASDATSTSPLLFSVSSSDLVKLKEILGQQEFVNLRKR